MFRISGEIGFDHFLQLAVFIHGNMQARNIAEALDIGQCCNIFRNRFIAQVAGLGGINIKPDVRTCHGCTVRFGDGSAVGHPVARFIGFTDFLSVQIDSGNAQFIQRVQFVLACFGVFILVAPHPQFFPYLIMTVYLTVMIAVILRERGIAMWCQSTIRQKGVVAENFPTVINFAITVQIKRQNTVIFIRPSRHLSKTALVVIKITPRSNSCGFDTVTIQIKDNGTTGIFGIFQTRIFIIFTREATVFFLIITISY